MEIKKEQLLGPAAGFLLFSPIFYFTTSSTRNFLIAVGITAIMIIVGTVVIKFLNLQGEPASLKEVLLILCFIFCGFNIAYFAITPLLDFPVSYTSTLFVVLFSQIGTFWKYLDLNDKEKGLVVVTLLMAIGTFVYSARLPRTAFDLYFDYLYGAESYEVVNALLVEDAKDSFTEEDFAEIRSLLQTRSPRFGLQFTVVGFSENRSLLLRTGSTDFADGLKIYEIGLLPEEISRFFWQRREGLEPYTIEMELDNKVAIGGQNPLFYTLADEQGWRDEMISVFNEASLPDELLAPAGPVVDKGVDPRGYIAISLDQGQEYDSMLFDEIYEIYRQTGLEMSVEDVLVVFYAN